MHRECVSEDEGVASELMELSQSKRGVSAVMLHHCCQLYGFILGSSRTFEHMWSSSAGYGSEIGISQSKVHYYSNSLQHQVWQTLLLLLPKLREEFVDTVADRVFEAGFCSNQASVKYLIEWMMVLILVCYPHHMDNFWTCFSKVREIFRVSSELKPPLMEVKLVQLSDFLQEGMRRIVGVEQTANSQRKNTWSFPVPSEC
ncbi:putative methyltransferase TARBP1 [Takifugu flavidus]|uniref:Putative methyltransferase TARBP1 n=1 Tax=Takifugu flavidus TaxID=433684 RepID=A0A5C6PIR6_9TELE|nr:putative methyltransferase TARBP1 [Takifugu flavidus]